MPHTPRPHVFTTVPSVSALLHKQPKGVPGYTVAQLVSRRRIANVNESRVVNMVPLVNLDCLCFVVIFSSSGVLHSLMMMTRLDLFCREQLDLLSAKRWITYARDLTDAFGNLSRSVITKA